MVQLLQGSTMSTPLRQQAQRLYKVLTELVRRYQFRDREEICCHGLSVSQCYALSALEQQGPMSMGELAEHLHLEISTMTRIVDYLVSNKLATRVADARDRRICRVRISRKGEGRVAKIHAELIKEYEAVLREVPPESREAVVLAISHLLSAFKERQRRCEADSGVKQRRSCAAG